MAVTGDDLIRLGEAIEQWAEDTKGALRTRLIALGLDEQRARMRGSSRLRIARTADGPRLQREAYLIESLRAAIKRRDLEVERVSFSFARHGIYLEVGVGKNRPKGSGKERPRPWITPVLPRAIEELSDLLANEYADIAAAQIKINVPGIFQTTISI